MQRIIVDTDGGIDDALALLYALASPDVSIEAITTVSGNVSLAQATRNVFEVLRVAGARNPPQVAQGAAAPLAGPLVSATDVHGEDGLGGWTAIRPAPDGAVSPIHASQLIPKLARSHPGEVTLVTLGPLTNLALALHADSDGLRSLKGIVVMGGTVWAPGNVSAVAEFNVYADPEAAREALHSGIPLTLVGLDATRQVALTREVLEASLGPRNDTRAAFLRHICNRLFSLYQVRSGGEICYLHDPLAIAVALDHTLVETQRLCLDVEVRGEISRGLVVAEQRPWVKSLPNAEVCVKTCAERFLDSFRERVLDHR
jgi:purine nucleosidase